MNFNQFKDKAGEILNINLGGYKLKRVKRRTDSLMRRHDIEDYKQCLTLLKKDPKFKAAYLDHFTINTSEFYRNPDNFKYLQEEILPQLFEKKRKINIWSAPCSNGSEPYTIAIILNEMGIQSNRYKILASDLDPQILEFAKTGIYQNSSLKNVSKNIITKYFKKLPRKNKYQLSNNIMKEVEFKEMNLINERYMKNWDLILSRNFFIYLTKDIKERLTKKFVSALNSKGYLFLGNTEFIFNPEKFNLKKEYLSFYKKKNI